MSSELILVLLFMCKRVLNLIDESISCYHYYLINCCLSTISIRINLFKLYRLTVDTTINFFLRLVKLDYDLIKMIIKLIVKGCNEKRVY